MTKAIKIFLVIIIALLICGSAFWLWRSQEKIEDNEEYSTHVYGQAFPQRDEAILDYLLTQKDFAWQTEEGSENFCVFENMGESDDLFPLSIWVFCQEYKVEDGKIRELSGVSGPVLIDYPNELSYFAPDKFTHRVPRDGSLYGTDIKEIFSKDSAEKILNYKGRNAIHEYWLERALDKIK